MNPFLTLMTKLPKPAGLMGVLIALLLLMWFLLPMIELNGSNPFASTNARIVLTAVIFC